MKRKILQAIFSLALSAGICGSAYAAETTMEMRINSTEARLNGVEITLDMPPVIVDGRTLVPVREAVEMMGGMAEWDAETKTAVLTTDKHRIELTVNSTDAIIDGEEQALDTAPAIIDDRTMIPLRFVAEGFGFYTDWDAETKTVYVAQTEDAEDEEYQNVLVGDDGTRFIFSESSVKAEDSNGSLIAEYMDTNKTEWFYTDKDNNKYKYYAEAEKTYFEKIGGERTELIETADAELTDKNGNIYYYVFSGGRTYLNVKNKKGDIIQRYTELYEHRYYYADENGNRLVRVISKDEGLDDGFIMPDGRFIQNERRYGTNYEGDDGKDYAITGPWFVMFDNEKKPEAEMLMIDSCDVYADEMGNEYRIYNNVDGVMTVEYPDGKKVVLSFENEEDTQIPESDIPDCYIYYLGSDGNKYTYFSGEEYDYRVTDKDDKAILDLVYKGCIDEYKAKNGTVYRIKTYFGNSVLIQPDGRAVSLTEIFG